MTRTDPKSEASWGAAGWGVLALIGFTVVALAGYGVFGLHPERIPEPLIGFWRVSYALFAQVHIILGAVVLGVALIRWGGLRWAAAFGAVYMISFLSEFLGTGYGFPFGLYEYSGLLGYRIADRVPWVIPLSWFLMAVPSWVLARSAVSGVGPGATALRIGFAAVLLTLWDLALDPAMSFQAPYYWIWFDTGPYYRMPWINLAGWLGTGVVLMGAMELLGIRRWAERMPVGWALVYYGATLLMPLGMILLEGLWIAVLVTTISYLLAWGAHRWLSSARRTAGAAIHSPARELA